VDDDCQFGYISKLNIYIYIYIGRSPNDKWEKENLKKKGKDIIQYCTSKIFMHVLTFGNMGYF